MADSNLTTTVNSVTIGGGGVYGLINYIGAFHIGGGIKRYTLNRGYFANNIFNNYSGGKKGRYGYGDASDKDAEKAYIDSTTGKIYNPDGASDEDRLISEQRSGDRIGDYYTTKGLPRVSTKEFMDTKTFSLLGQAIREEQSIVDYNKDNRILNARFGNTGVDENNYKVSEPIKTGNHNFGDSFTDIEDSKPTPTRVQVKDNEKTQASQNVAFGHPSNPKGGINDYSPYEGEGYHLPPDDDDILVRGKNRLSVYSVPNGVNIKKDPKHPEGFKVPSSWSYYTIPEGETWTIKNVGRLVRNYYKDYARFIPEKIDERPVLFAQLTAEQQTKALNFGEDIGDIVPDIGWLYLDGSDRATWINGFNYYPFGIKYKYRPSAISAATQNSTAQKGPDGYYRYFPKPYSSAVKTNGDKQEIVQYSVSDELNGNSLIVDKNGRTHIEEIPSFENALISYTYKGNGLSSTNYAYYEEAEKGTTHPLELVTKETSFNGTVINIKESSSTSNIVRNVNAYFRNGKIKSLINRFHTDTEGEAVEGDFISSKSAFGLSRGRNLLKGADANGDILLSENGYENPYCRVWTAHKQYSTMKDLIRPFMDGKRFRHLPDLQRSLYGSDGTTRPDAGKFEYSVLQDSGFVKIAPHRDDSGTLINNSDDLKKYMFSIENLAWKGYAGNDSRFLSEEQRGPNGGRIMWFPPYNLKFNENVNTTWKDNDFIGRGEKIYTYVNTERAGTLNFTLLIDHPSIINKWDKGNSDIKEETEQQLLRFFAGCEELTSPEDSEPRNDEDEREKLNEPLPTPPVTPEPVLISVMPFYFIVFFPNDFSGVDFKDIEKYVEIMDKYETTSDGSVVNVVDEKYAKELLSLEENKTNINRYSLNTNTGLNVYDITKRVEEIVPEVREINHERYNKIYSYQDLKEIGKKLASGSMTSLYQDPDEPYSERFYEIDSITVKGYASSDGKLQNNIDLAKKRKKTTENLIRYYFNAAESLFKDEPYKEGDGVLTVGKTYDELAEGGFTDDGLLKNTEKINRLDAKIARCAVVTVNMALKKRLLPYQEVEETQEEEEEDTTTTPQEEQVRNELVIYTVPGEYTYQNEYLYFKEIKEENNIVYKNIIDKIQYFDPAFHSITPEGFNSRLNFLHQCTRQGPTIGSHSGGDNKKQQTEDNTFAMAGNLAFGTAPYCILRIGDFFYSKIVITSVQIDYDTGSGIQWDLNPEGVGVQPMMANVSISFNFLGGQDITGPVAELQNAVSFNYYANSSLYEHRRRITE